MNSSGKGTHKITSFLLVIATLIAAYLIFVPEALAQATWRAAEDTDSGVLKGQNIRLRFNIANTGGTATNYTFRLEYASRVGGACGDDESFLATPVSITAANEHFEMTTSTYFADSDPTTARLANTEGYTFVAGRMVEDPSNTTAAITLGTNQYTEIEYNFQASTYAVENGIYCFRVTNAGTVLNNYSIYAELTVKGSATWMVAEDTAVSNIQKQANIRLRFNIANTGGTATNYTFRLEYASRVGGACGDDESFLAMPVSITAANEHFEMTTSIYVSNSASTTAKLANSEGYAFVSGFIVADPSNTSPAITLGTNQYTEIEYVFQASTYVTGGGPYCFRVTNAGAVLDGYSIYPELTITTGVGALTISSPASAAFPAKNVSTVSQNSIVSISYVEVSDTRAGSPGWSATMTSQRYTTRGGVYRLAGNNSTVGFSETYTGSYGVLSPVGTYIVEITTGGGVGIAIFKWTSPLGTLTENVFTASTIVLNAGISVNFGAATYQVGDKWQIAVDVFPYTGLYATPSDITLISGSLTGVSKGVAEYLTGSGDTSNAKTIMSANVGYGTGVYRQDEGLDLIIHINSLAGDYSAVVVFTAL